MSTNEQIIKDKIKAEFISYLTAHEYTINQDASYEDAVICFYNYKEKRIPIKKYEVLFSRELTSKLTGLDDEKTSTLNLFKCNFENGIDMNCHLSKYIFGSQFDYLLNYWSIKHLHLNSNVANSKSEMTNNRSDTYLLVLVDEFESKVYFLDVIPHLSGDEFADINFLWILFNNNWIEHAGFAKIENCVSISYQITSKEDLMSLWKSHINYAAFEFNGAFYFNYRKGTTMFGNSMNSQEYLINANRCIDSLLARCGSDTIKNIKVDILEDKGIPTYGIQIEW